MSQKAGGAPLMEEAFNYPVGSSLGTNTPWAGSAGASLSIVTGSLSITNLRDTIPPGNQLQVTGAASASAYRTFSTTPITGGVVYFSTLIDCSVLPTNSRFMACLLSSGATQPNQPDDPLDLYVQPRTNGYGFSIGHTGNDPVTASAILTTNTLHLIVMKYAYGSGGQVSLYIDPTPGAAEPAVANARTELGEGNDAPDLQNVLFQTSNNRVGEGVWNFDTLRIGTNWSDVTPLPIPLSLAGPPNVAVCVGSPATLSVMATGTPPYYYTWRGNGVAIPNATNSSYQLANPGPVDVAKLYDVVVQDGFGSVTSQVARITLTTNAASIVLPPTNVVVMPTDTNAIFNVTAGGDAPLSYQWRSNGIAINSATNSSYNITNPSNSTAVYDVVVANPCGTVTSSPPVSLLFPHVFYAAYDAGPGFFSGENILLTNAGGLLLQAWSSSSLTLSVTNWNLEGALQEQPLNDGTGRSIYSINVTPMTSPVYYIISTTTAGPYLPLVPLEWITTDVSGSYLVFNTNVLISSDGFLNFLAPPSISLQPVNQSVLAGMTAQFSVTASGTAPLSYQWYFNTVATAPATTNYMLIVPNVTASQNGSYYAIVTNAFGAATSQVVSLTVAPVPQLVGRLTGNQIQLNAQAVPGMTCSLQACSNLSPPLQWTTIQTTLADSNGLVFFADTNTSFPFRFYRISAP